MTYSPPSSVQGAKRAISTRTKKLPLATSEKKRIELQEEIDLYVDYLYHYAKPGEAALKVAEKPE